MIGHGFHSQHIVFALIFKLCTPSWDVNRNQTLCVDCHRTHVLCGDTPCPACRPTALVTCLCFVAHTHLCQPTTVCTNIIVGVGDICMPYSWNHIPNMWCCAAHTHVLCGDTPCPTFLPTALVISLCSVAHTNFVSTKYNVRHHHSWGVVTIFMPQSCKHILIMWCCAAAHMCTHHNWWMWWGLHDISQVFRNNVQFPHAPFRHPMIDGCGGVCTQPSHATNGFRVVVEYNYILYIYIIVGPRPRVPPVFWP